MNQGVGRKSGRHRAIYSVLFIVLLLAAAGAYWFWPRLAVTTAGPLRLTPTQFSELPGWWTSDARPALAAFRRSCAALAAEPATRAMGGAGYAGTVGDWEDACRAVPDGNVGAAAARNYFESWFAPFVVGAGSDREGLFTGYYEPELRASRVKSTVYRTPIYGLPDDLVGVDLGQFRDAFRGEHIEGRLEGSRLVPYPTRAEIDAHGLPHAAIILYTDDPVAAFFLQIQGSGRARLPDGSLLRLAFAGVNGRRYTAIGHVLIAEGVLNREDVSLQTIRTWLHAHPGDAERIMESDASFVFFREAPLGDPALGSEGSEGVALTPGASLAVDPKLHALGAPFFVAASSPDPDASKPDHVLDRLLIAQDTGGAITGSVRGDVFWGWGPSAEAIAGRMKSRGELYVLLPRALARDIVPDTEYPGASQ